MIAVYRERLDRWCADAEQACVQRGVTYRRVVTDTPLEDLLLDRLRRIGLLH
jgi:hypothetical protein